MEDIMAGATVLFLNATDLDRSREYGQESIIFSLEGSSHFRINARSGEITTTSLLDREAKSEYILIVRAVDGGVGHNQKTGIATVNITLLDINDNYPVWKDEPYFINLVEMTPPNSDVTTIEEGQRGELLGSIGEFGGSQLADVVKGVGPGSMCYNGMCHNATSAPPLVSSCTLRRQGRAWVVQGEQLQARPPTGGRVLSMLQHKAMLCSSFSSTGTLDPLAIEQVAAFDPDLAENGSLIYSIRPPNKFYSLNSTTGKIRTTGVILDRENPNPQEAELMRKIVVSVTDRGRPPLRATSSATVFVNLLDLNDNDPTFQNLPFITEIPEGLPAGSSVFQVVAIDVDEGLNGQVTYRMQVGMPRMDFLVNSSTGLINSTTVLDRERIAEYYLRVVASDAGVPSKSSTSTLTVRILDVNDENPTFFPAVYNVSLPENIPRDFKVVRLNCTDADVGLNAELSYFITDL
ncbi:UNVERIFIED_CONTAM: Cadherin-23 [Gekko kuhli]